ncbi:MAG: hypothetical protein C0513_04205 [Isosphaera sp.]|nr:hypothetical protein [Isosphaera sp.]
MGAGHADRGRVGRRAGFIRCHRSDRRALQRHRHRPRRGVHGRDRPDPRRRGRAHGGVPADRLRPVLLDHRGVTPSRAGPGRRKFTDNIARPRRANRARGPIGGNDCRVRSRGFTLIELLVVVAIVAALIGVLAPALSRVRESGRSSVCLSNLRQAFIVCRAYGDEHRGRGPAIGAPFTASPNWAFVVQASAGRSGTSADEVLTADSVLVCPSNRAFNGVAMTRTYAMNVTGHNRAAFAADPDSFDDPSRPVHIRMDGVSGASKAVMLMDAAQSPSGPGLPPSTRSWSVIDLRLAQHLDERLGWFHGGVRAEPRASGLQGRVFQAVYYDGSARAVDEVTESLAQPLP